MTTDSSLVGYLAPWDYTDLEDARLNGFLQGLVSGITGMRGNVVFQRWQPGGEPPNMPKFGSDWAAIGEANRSRDTFANVIPQKDYVIIYRNQIISVLCSFYGPNSRANCEILSMGFMLPQNRESMLINGYGYVDQADSIVTADKFNERWVQRIDLPFRLRRAQAYSYPVLNLVGAQGMLEPANDSITITPTLPMFGWGPETNYVAGWGTGSWTD